MNKYSLVYTGENISWNILLVRIYVKKNQICAQRHLFKNVHFFFFIKVKSLK